MKLRKGFGSVYDPCVISSSTLLLLNRYTGISPFSSKKPFLLKDPKRMSLTKFNQRQKNVFRGGLKTIRNSSSYFPITSRWNVNDSKHFSFLFEFFKASLDILV